MPVRGRHGALAGDADGRPRRAPARREGRPQAGRAAALARERLARATTAGCRPCATSRWTCAPGEIVGLAGIDANGQSELIETIMGLRKPDEGTIKVAGRDVTHAGPRATLDSGVSHIAEDRHRRGLVLEFDLAENLALREYNTPGLLQPRLPLPEEDGRPRAQAAQGVRRPRRRPGDPRRLAVGRQPAEGRDRARAQRRPAGDHRRAADARARRGRDRVRAPAPGRGARRGPRGVPGLARDGGDPVLERSCAGDLRGADRGRDVTRVLRGGLRRDDDRRRARQEEAA